MRSDIIYEVYISRNSRLADQLLKRVIDLHYVVRGDLYGVIMKKVCDEYMAADGRKIILN